MSRKIVEDVLGPRDAHALWGAGYRAVLPITPQGFALGSVLPAVLYMTRWGQLRGHGSFAKIYDRGGPEKRKATIGDVARGLSDRSQWFEDFDSEAGRAILGDLLLAYCLDNLRHDMGRDKQVQRVFPTHYFSSWIDLPTHVTHLRGIPELVVTILAHQSEGKDLKRGGRGFFGIGKGFTDKGLLSLFGTGTYIDGQADNLGSDRFDESAEIGLDQLLMVRLAQSLEHAPSKLHGGTSAAVSNQHTIASRAADIFREDISVFLRAFGDNLPRQSLLPMLDACLALGLTAIYLSTFNMLLHWSRTGTLPHENEQRSWPLFVDCSMSTDNSLRRASEESMDDLLHRLRRLPSVMMCLRILEQRAEQEHIADFPPETPFPSARVNFLGDLLFDRVEASRDIKRDLDRTCQKLADALQSEQEETPALSILLEEQLHPAWRLADCLVVMMGSGAQYEHYRKFLHSCMNMDDPNGIGRRRISTVNNRRAERRSLVLTNTALDFLVHRHLCGANKGVRPRDLSLQAFIRILRDRYGFYIDESPPGLHVSVDLLASNRSFLERRLRDLGLFLGVNDAESMKRLRARFDRTESNDRS